MEERFKKLPLKSNYANGTNAKYCYFGYGPMFGGGHDIEISGSTGSTNLCVNYCDSSMVFDAEPTKTYLAGTHTFTVADIEIYTFN